MIASVLTELLPQLATHHHLPLLVRVVVLSFVRVLMSVVVVVVVVVIVVVLAVVHVIVVLEHRWGVLRIRVCACVSACLKCGPGAFHTAERAPPPTLSAAAVSQCWYTSTSIVSVCLA